MPAETYYYYSGSPITLGNDVGKSFSYSDYFDKAKKWNTEVFGPRALKSYYKNLESPLRPLYSPPVYSSPTLIEGRPLKSSISQPAGPAPFIKSSYDDKNAKLIDMGIENFFQSCINDYPPRKSIAPIDALLASPAGYGSSYLSSLTTGSPYYHVPSSIYSSYNPSYSRYNYTYPYAYYPANSSYYDRYTYPERTSTVPIRPSSVSSAYYPGSFSNYLTKYYNYASYPHQNYDLLDYDKSYYSTYYPTKHTRYDSGSYYPAGKGSHYGVYYPYSRYIDTYYPLSTYKRGLRSYYNLY